MERRAAHVHPPGPGWLRSLLGAGALVGTGFAAGLCFGVAFEDPGLVLGFVTGQTESVELAALEPESPAVASAPPPLGAGPAAAPRPAAPRPPPAVASPPPPGSFLVQVGAFAERGAAERLDARLRGLGLPVFVEPAEAGGGWRVRVGPFGGEPEAQRVARRLKEEQKLPTWVLRAEVARPR
jgi:cell division septation protein DedD